MIRTTNIVTLEYLMSQQYRLVANMDAVYDNSKPFSAYLEKEGLAELLRKTKLKLRDRHTVVPHVSIVALM